MMKLHRHHRAALTLLCALLVLSTDAGPASVPKRGGTLHLIQTTDLRAIDPAISYQTDTLPITRLCFRGLLGYDDGTGLVLDQAQDWNISPDGKTYTFHLRPGIKFSNGREVEAEDYVFSLERIINPATGSPGQGFFTGIQGAQDFAAGKTNHVSGLSAPDKRTLIVQLEKPNYTFRYAMAMTFAMAVPRDIVSRYGKDFQYYLVGSGPYVLTEYKRGVRWRFDRNPYYTGPDGYVDHIELMIGGDDATQTMMLERNEVDQLAADPPDAIRFKHDPRLSSQLVGIPTVSTDYFFMNTEMKPFDNALVRQAVNYAINRKRLVQLTGDFAVPAKSIVPPNMPWSNPGLPDYDYNPKKARELLREAGFTNGFKTTLSYQEDIQPFPRVAQSIQQDLQQVGIDAALHPINDAAFMVAAETRHQLECGVWSWYQDYPDASDFLDVMFNGRYISETDCNDTSFYNNPAVNRLLDEATSSLNTDERIRLMQQAEVAIMRDAPIVPLMHEILPYLYSTRVHGNQPHPVWLWRVEWMWLDPQ